MAGLPLGDKDLNLLLMFYVASFTFVRSQFDVALNRVWFNLGEYLS